MFTVKFIKTSFTPQHLGLSLCIGQVLWPVVCSLQKSVLAKNWQMNKEKGPSLLKDLRNLQKLLKQVWSNYWDLNEHLRLNQFMLCLSFTKWHLVCCNLSHKFLLVSTTCKIQTGRQDKWSCFQRVWGRKPIYLLKYVCTSCSGQNEPYFQGKLVFVYTRTNPGKSVLEWLVRCLSFGGADLVHCTNLDC